MFLSCKLQVANAPCTPLPGQSSGASAASAALSESTQKQPFVPEKKRRRFDMASQCNIAVTKASKDITLAVRQLDAAVSQAESSKKEIEAKDAYKSHTALFEAHSKELARRINLATLICGRKKPVEPAVPGAPAAGLAQAAQPAPVAPALQQPLPTAIAAALAGFTFAPVTNGTLLMPQKEAGV